MIELMANNNAHGAVVDDWLERCAIPLSSSEELVRLFEEAFTALWQRAHRALGEVTLNAIVDRVLYNARERFSFFSSLEPATPGLRCDGLRGHAGSLHRDQLAEGMRFVLVEFLTVLGNLTADILTPALHSELSKSALVERAAEARTAEARTSEARESHGESPNPEHNGEDAES